MIKEMTHERELELSSLLIRTIITQRIALKRVWAQLASVKNDHI